MAIETKKKMYQKHVDVCGENAVDYSTFTRRLEKRTKKKAIQTPKQNNGGGRKIITTVAEKCDECGDPRLIGIKHAFDVVIIVAFFCVMVAISLYIIAQLQ